MQKIHLISLQLAGPNPDWELGKVWSIKPKITDLGKLVKDCLSSYPYDWFLFFDSSFGIPAYQTIQKLTQESVDLCHAGLKSGLAGHPGLLDFVAPTWTFNRDPAPDIEATSWRVSLRACLVRGEVIQKLGFLETGFETLDCAALEWGHRCIQHGALPRHHPGLLPDKFQAPAKVTFPFADQLRFIDLRYGRKWTIWAMLRALLTGYASPKQALPAWRKLTRERLPAKAAYYQSARLQNPTGESRNTQNPGVSVLIPTLERYPYLRTLLQQLGEQSHPPHEILVIDQTPQVQRQPELYQAFVHLPLRVLYQEQAGQCSSRNLGLQTAKGDYILFLDDDDEIPPDLVEKHLQNLENSASDASCGVADEVGAGPLPAAFTHRRASDVFPTNNTLLRRKALFASGLFDLAYEHGSRADGDLGMRLYLSGAKMILEPNIRLLHHHAPRGGLRTHKARKTTYASSRLSLLQRRIPSITEFYWMQRFFSPRQIRERIYLSLLGTLSLHNTGYRRWLKAIVSGLLMPHSLWVILQRNKAAQDMFKDFPQIPSLEREHNDR